MEHQKESTKDRSLASSCYCRVGTNYLVIWTRSGRKISDLPKMAKLDLDHFTPLVPARAYAISENALRSRWNLTCGLLWPLVDH